VDICKDLLVQDPTHEAAIKAALEFFKQTSGQPQFCARRRLREPLPLLADLPTAVNH